FVSLPQCIQSDSFIPYTTLFRSCWGIGVLGEEELSMGNGQRSIVNWTDRLDRFVMRVVGGGDLKENPPGDRLSIDFGEIDGNRQDRKSTRLNSSHVKNSYTVFCL